MEKDMDPRLFIDDNEYLYVSEGDVFKLPYSILKNSELFSNFDEVLEVTLEDVRKLGGPKNNYWEDLGVDCETCPHMDGWYDCDNKGSGLIQQISTAVAQIGENKRFMVEFPICSVNEALFLNLYKVGQMDSYKLEGVSPAKFYHRNELKIGDERVPELVSIYESLKLSKN